MATQKPHMVCIPCPFQGHINLMIKLMNILHYKGFYITLVLTEFIYATLTSSMAQEFRSLQNLHDFRFETIPDGLPSESKRRGALELAKLIGAFLGDDMKKHLRGLLMKLHSFDDIPRVSSIIADAFIVFPVDVGKELNKRSAKSVIYVNFGSLVMFNVDQLREFAWRLANSNHYFLWVILSDLIEGDSSIITYEFMEEIKEGGLLLSWCPQEKVLQHPSIAVFLTHCGWNSILESISQGVPMICWPYFGDQHINSLYACQEWKIALKMEECDVKRQKVEQFVREMMEGEQGKDLKRNILELKKKAEKATRFGGSSNKNFDELMKYLLEIAISH